LLAYLLTAHAGRRYDLTSECATYPYIHPYIPPTAIASHEHATPPYQAVVMTSPLLATLGLSTMIPLSVVADYSRGLANLTPMFFMGTVMVFVGFQLENWEEAYTWTDAAKAENQ